MRDRVLLEAVAAAEPGMRLSELDALLSKQTGRAVPPGEVDVAMRSAQRKGWLFSDGIRLQVLAGGRRELNACAYGVPRAQCHVGCGRTCRRLNDPQPVPACCGGCDRPAGHAPCSTEAPFTLANYTALGATGV